MKALLFLIIFIIPFGITLYSQEVIIIPSNPPDPSSNPFPTNWGNSTIPDPTTEYIWNTEKAVPFIYVIGLGDTPYPYHFLEKPDTKDQVNWQLGINQILTLHEVFCNRRTDPPKP